MAERRVGPDAHGERGVLGAVLGDGEAAVDGDVLARIAVVEEGDRTQMASQAAAAPAWSWEEIQREAERATSAALEASRRKAPAPADCVLVVTRTLRLTITGADGDREPRIIPNAEEPPIGWPVFSGATEYPVETITGGSTGWMVTS